MLDAPIVERAIDTKFRRGPSAPQNLETGRRGQNGIPLGFLWDGSSIQTAHEDPILRLRIRQAWRLISTVMGWNRKTSPAVSSALQRVDQTPGFSD